MQHGVTAVLWQCYGCLTAVLQGACSVQGGLASVLWLSYGCVTECMQHAGWPCGWQSSTSTTARCPAPVWPLWRCWAVTALSCAPTSTPVKPCWLTGSEASLPLLTDAKSCFAPVSRQSVSTLCVCVCGGGFFNLFAFCHKFTQLLHPDITALVETNLLTHAAPSERAPKQNIS